MHTLKHTFITLLIILTTSIAASRPAVKKPNHDNRAGFTTESYLVANSDGIILSEHNSELQRPIASISKLMVSMLASVQDLDERLIIPFKRAVQSSIPFKQTSLARRELLTLALVKSDNLAAQILCDNIPNCIEEMNLTASGIGMLHTHFSEPTGLSKENISTASDLLKLMMVASSNYTITSLSSMPKAVIPVNKGVISIQNTNSLTGKLDIFLSKTGFTNPAGGCLIMAVNSPVGQRFIVLLGSRTARTRIPDMEKLYKELI